MARDRLVPNTALVLQATPESASLLPGYGYDIITTSSPR